MRIIVGHLRSQTGRVNEVQVLDLSLGGCMINLHAMGVRVDDRVLIRLPGLRHVSATVIWIEDGRAGLAFEEPLYQPVFEHLQKAYVEVPG